MLHLGVRSIVEFDHHVAAAWSQQCWIKFFKMISCHENDGALLRSDAIECVQKAREGHMFASSLLCYRFSLHEDSIDILEKNN